MKSLAKKSLTRVLSFPQVSDNPPLPKGEGVRGQQMAGKNPGNGFRSVFLALFVICNLLFVSSASEAIPQMINYQGKLTDASGAAIADTKSIVFKIYDAASSGNELWTETQGSVSVEAGIFNVQLGSGTALPVALFTNEALYLGINVAGDGEMTPRQRLVTTSYAFNSSYLDGKAASSYLLKAGDNVTGTFTMEGRVVYTPSATQSIAAGTGVSAAMLVNKIIRIEGSGGAVDISADPQIADGVDGQVIILQGTSDTNTVKFDDGTGLALSGGVSFTMGVGDTLQLMYAVGTPGIWYEISRSDN